MNNTFPVFVPIHKRLSAEFIAKREEILKASSQAQLSPDTEEKLKEIDVMLEGLAAQELPN
jgi:hypothetical protein